MRRAMKKANYKGRSRKSGVAPAMAGIAFAILVIVVFFWYWKGSQNGIASTAAAASPAPVQSGGAAPAAPFAGSSFPSQGHAHLSQDEPDDFVYNSNPPTSGPHKEMFTDQFVNPSPLPPYVQVHLLEHGNIMLQYDCTCPDVAASLAAIAYEYDSKLIAPNELQPTPNEVQMGEEQGRAVIVAPYPSMRSRVAVTAWTRLGTLTSVDKPKIESFIGLYLTNEANASQ
jgi:hypothetical protein